MNRPILVLGAGLVILMGLVSAEWTSSAEPAASPPTGRPEQSRARPIDDLIGLPIRGADGKELGTVDDLVLDSLDGSIDYLVMAQGGVLGIGEDRYLVPYESFKVGAKPAAADDDGLRVTTVLSEERVRKAPKLAPKQRIGPDVERASREAAGLAPEPMQPRAKESELVAATRVKGATVLGVTEEKLGQMEDVVVDPAGAVVAHTVLAASPSLGLEQKSFSLAWEVTRVRLEAGDKLVIDSKLTKETLAKAGETEAKKPDPVLTAPRARDR